MKTLYPTLCTAALLMLAACTQDPVEDLVSSGNTQSGDLPEGTFIVDYLPSADLPATRGLGEGEAILSLDYLLYTSTDGGTTYTLTKKKSISDIDANTSWPLTRENMTWAQRQELKDTLSTESKYKVVFVANAADEVWKDKTCFQPMTNVVVKTVTEDGTETVAGSTFDQARLLLPPNGDFQQTDGTYTFYYMWTGEIDPANGYNKNTPAQMNVVLQRMVNKVEIRLEDITEGFTDEKGNVTISNINRYVEEQISEFYTNNGYVTENHEGKIYDKVCINMDAIAQSIPDGHNVTTEEKSKKTFKDNFINNETKRKDVVKSLTKCSEGEPCDKENPCVKHWLINKMKNEYLARCNWSIIHSIRVVYDKANFPQSIGFDKKYKPESDVELPSLNSMKIADNDYIFYAFGHNEDDATASNLGQIKELKFIGEESDKDLFTATCNIIPGIDSENNINYTGGNHHLVITYNPISNTNVGDEKTFTRTDYNLQEVMNWDWGIDEDNSGDFDYGGLVNWTKDKMIKWVNELFHPETSELSGSEFMPYDLTLEIPVIAITDEWSTKEYKPE